MRIPPKNLLAVFAMPALAACSHGGENHAGAASSAATAPAARSPGGRGWARNGATACEKYLTADFVRQVFGQADGKAKRLADWSCTHVASAGNINITLMQGDLAVFEADQKNLSNPIPLSGVGDKAVNSVTGVEAVKGDRMCDIGVMPPFGARLRGEARAHKLGEVCNKLFALP